MPDKQTKKQGIFNDKKIRNHRSLFTMVGKKSGNCLSFKKKQKTEVKDKFEEIFC